MAQTAMFVDVEGILADSSAGLSPTLCSGAVAVVQRMNIAGVPVVALRQESSATAEEQACNAALKELVHSQGAELAGVYAAGEQPSWAFPKPGALLQAGQDLDIDVFSSWLITASTDGIKAAGQAGCLGVIVIGDAEEPAGMLGPVVNRAADLADAPRVMIPPQGGCWHDHRQA